MTKCLGRRDFIGAVVANGGLLASLGLSPITFALGRGDRGGFSATRLKAVSAAMQGFVDRGEAAGIVIALHRHGSLAQMTAVGWQDKEAGVPMKPDAIFRLASMGKPLLTAATLTLIDQGTLSLNDPVEKFVPELGNRKVLRDPAGPLEDTVPASRSIRIVDLLTHHSGLTPGLPIAILSPDAPRSPLTQAMVDADKARQISPDTWVEQVAKLPLAYDPGSKFNYAISFDMLGVLLARATGMSLPEFMRARLFEPLGMKDTGFQVPPEKQARMAKVYTVVQPSVTKDTERQSLPGKHARLGGVYDAPHTGNKISPKEELALPQISPATFPSGEGGMYSTAHDYLQAARMLLGRGRCGDVRILSHRAVDLMTANYLPLEERDSLGAEFGFGLGVAVVEDLAKEITSDAASPLLGGYASVGSYGWPGAFGTCWVVDPKEDLVQLFMIQLQPNERAMEIFKVFQALTYQAIDD